MRVTTVIPTLLATAVIAAPTRAAEEPNERGRRGFEVMLRPAYGAAGAKSPVVYRRPPLLAGADPDLGEIFAGTAEPYGGGFNGELSLGYRFLPLASAGLYGGLRSSSAEEPQDGTRDLSRSAWGAGFYGRFYLPMIHEALDPYVQLGIGYAQDTQSFTRPVTALTPGGPVTLDADWEITHHGVVIPLAIGVHYRVLPILSVGPSFRYDIVLPAGGCLKGSASFGTASDTDKYCTDEEDDRRIVEAEGYGVWSAGLDVKLTL
jgi:hypothetical protein